MSYSIIFETKIVKLSDGRLLHLNLSGCNNDDAGRSRDDWNGKIYTENAFIKYAEGFMKDSKPLAESLTDDANYSDLRDLAVEYVDALYTESEKTNRTDFNSVVNALTDAWAYYFCIEKPENKKLKIKLSDGRELVVEVNNYDGNHEEICVYTLDKTDPKNMLFQDICMVREDEKEPGRVECLVWADANEEDYTDRYSIGKYEEE
mgnify:CR=1 FL=1